MNDPTPIGSDSIDVETGMVISDTRSSGSTLYRIMYVDQFRVLMRSNEHNARTGRRHYRTDFRDEFDEYLRLGRYEQRPEEQYAETVSSDGEEVAWSDVDGVGKKTEAKLRESGIEVAADLHVTPDSDLISVYGMSEAKLSRLKEFVNE